MTENKQLNLGELIKKFEHVKNMKLPVLFDYDNYGPIGINSWRGYYPELAIMYQDLKYKEKFTAQEFLRRLKEANGKTYTGWKGGNFKMNLTTPIWVVSDWSMSDGFNDETSGIYDIQENEYCIILKTKYFEF